MKVNPPVFTASVALTALFVLFGALFPSSTAVVLQDVQSGIVEGFGWLYVGAVTFFLAFVLWLLVSPYGRLRLGKPTDRPQFTRPAWFAMLFSAGMGIGLLFFSVAEPLQHFAAPRDAAAGTVAAAQEAMTLTFLHWGLHAWAIYIVVGLSLAYFAYRHDLTPTVRATLYPLIGNRIHGPLGHTVDTLAVLGTLFGVATSLGLGALQINAGLAHVGLLPQTATVQLLVIAAITGLTILSVASGLDQGMRRLSLASMALSLVFALFVLVTGPTLVLLRSTLESVGLYFQDLIQLSLQTDSFRTPDWQADWTLFYWGWWIAWAPFVGMFFARISRGRTIREFIMGVLFVPPALTFAWMVIFGHTAIVFDLMGGVGLAQVATENPSIALFALLAELPLTPALVGLAFLVIVGFFVTSSDAGSQVTDILTSGAQADRPAYQRLVWAGSQGAVAGTLLLSGGLAALQTGVLVTALPFTFILLIMSYGLIRGLRTERVTLSRTSPWGEQAMPGSEADDEEETTDG